MEEINAVITGVGGYVPDYILDNEEMSTIVETSDEWIMERIGVKTRHILKPEQGSGTSYMMTRAVQQLLRKTGANPDTIELVIFYRLIGYWQLRTEERLWIRYGSCLCRIPLCYGGWSLLYS